MGRGFARTISTRLAARVTRAPFGILLIVTFLAIVSLGSVVGGAYLAVRGPDRASPPVLLSLLIGPIVLYIAYRLLSLERWTWFALAGLLMLLAASTVYRIVVSPGTPTGALVEMALEALAAAYLTRPAVRRAFSRSASANPGQ